MDFLRNGEREEDEEREGRVVKQLAEGISNMDLEGLTAWLDGGERESFVDLSANKFLSLLADSLTVNTPLLSDSDSEDI